MFEFAISQQEKHRPSRRFLASMVASIITHALTIALLVEYPQLLGTGLKYWLRRPLFFSSSTPREPSWRTVTILGTKNGKMQMPSSKTLKQFTYNWAAHGGAGKNPPIRIRWNDDAAEGGEQKPAVVPKPIPGRQEPKPVPEVAGTEPTSGAGKTEGTSTGGGTAPVASVAANDSSGGRGSTVYLPPPDSTVEPKQIPKKAAETSGMVAPTSIPKEVPGTNPPLPRTTNTTPAKNTQSQVFENQQKAIQSPDTGFFDTKGFPLGDYASVIIERVKGNWSIPSNLRNSQGRTTVIFFIDKDGRYTDARIVNSSGSSSLDLAALNAIIGSNPFPPLPKGFPGNHVGAKFVFSYNERQ